MKRRTSGFVALALLAAGCGSTVQATGTEQVGGSGSQSLSVPGGSAPVGGGTPGAVAPGAGLGGVPGSNGGGVPGSVGNGAGQVGASGGGSGTTGGGADVQAGDGPGVTATTINIAAAYDPNVSSADAAIGAANANPGDVKAETDAVIAYINNHGGVAHRKVVPVWYRSNTSDDTSTTDQKACNYWTQDHKTFVLSAGDALLDACTARSGGIALNAGAIALETTAQNQKYPQDINLTSFTIDHSMLVTINGLAKQGYFSKGGKFGIVTWDDPYYHYGITQAANPALARLGLHGVPVQYVAVPQALQDISETSAAAGNAVLKFRTMGIDHVLIFDGPAGVTSSGVLFLEWTQQANSQHYYPKHGLNSTSGFNAFGSEVPRQELEGAQGVGWLPSLEETSSDWANTPIPPNGKLCLKIMKDAGQQQSGANAQAVQLAICDTLFFLKQVLDPVTGPLNRQTALAAINSIGTRFLPSVTFGVDLSASRHDGAYLVRNMAFQDGCGCFRYTSRPYNPY